MAAGLLGALAALGILSARKTVTHPTQEYGGGDASLKARMEEDFRNYASRIIFGWYEPAREDRYILISDVAPYVWGRWPLNVDRKMRVKTIVGYTGLTYEEFSRRYAESQIYLEYGIANYSGPQKLYLPMRYGMEEEKPSLYPFEKDPTKMVDCDGYEWFKTTKDQVYDILRPLREQRIKEKRELLFNKMFTK